MVSISPFHEKTFISIGMSKLNFIESSDVPFALSTRHLSDRLIVSAIILSTCFCVKSFEKGDLLLYFWSFSNSPCIYPPICSFKASSAYFCIRLFIVVYICKPSLYMS